MNPKERKVERKVRGVKVVQSWLQHHLNSVHVYCRKASIQFMKVLNIKTYVNLLKKLINIIGLPILITWITVNFLYIFLIVSY